MGGIAGIFHPDVPKPVDPARVRAMTDVQAHRGPDGSGVWTAPGVGLGHRRLAIIDSGEGGTQPMLTGDGRVVITFDGGIYNFREVRAELERRGHIFRTASDTEVILASWREWGAACVTRLHGAFAFALFDADADALFLARDRLGVKPLHYAELSDGALVFASELKGLLAHPMLRRAPSPQAVEDYLAFGYVPDDASIVAGVKKLPAGATLLIQRGRPIPQPSPYWDADFSSPSTERRSVLQEQLVAHMREAVRSRMVADVPLGAFLSGGVDSSAVVALMAESSRTAVETCSIGFDEPDWDETRFAAQVAERFATSHRSRTVASDDFDLVDTLVDAFDEPVGDASALACLRLSELAREKIKISLSGDGADEIFAGYGRYRRFMGEERARGLFPAAFRRWLGNVGGQYPRLALQALGQSSEMAYAGAVIVTSPALRHRLYRDGFRRSLQDHEAEERYARVMRNAPADDPLSRAQYADLKISLPGDILTRADRTSMAVSLEAREPWLDHRLVEFAAKLPPRMRLRGGTGKWLFKKSMERYLPQEILHHGQVGFVSPASAWFRGPLGDKAAGIAHGSALAETGWFDETAIARLAAEHRSGRAEHGRLLWQLLMLDKSLQRLFGVGASPQSGSAYSASTKYSPSGGALKPKAARSRA